MYLAPVNLTKPSGITLRLLAGLLLAVCCGCAGTKAPAREGEPGPAGTKDYRLQSGDQVDLQIYREPQLSGTFRVDGAGDLRHPLFGAFPASGLSAGELELRLTELLGQKYLVNPKVMVSVVSAQSSHVVILGEVKTPGVHPVPFGESITLLQAIAKAGGFTQLARVNWVTVTRTVDGKETSIRANVSKMISGEEPDMPLKPNDVIMVPQIIF
jgi:protein involved in polysaccharide export with SLBB domain